MMVLQRNNRIIISVTIVMVAVSLLIALFPMNSEDIYVRNYAVDSFCLVASITMLLSMYIYGKLDLFEPITFISFIYILVYFVTPIYDIIIKEYTWYGYDLFPYGIKATLVTFAGFCSFFVSYNANISIKKKVRFFISTQATRETRTKQTTQKIITSVLAMYLFCFTANAFYLVRGGGNSLIYLLSLGLLGEGKTVEQIDAAIGFVSMFSYCLPAITLMYIEYGKSRTLKVILFVPMVMLQVARGFRFFVIQIAVTFFTYYYLKKKQRPKLRSIILSVLALMVPVVIMTMFRNSVRGGTGVDFSQVNGQSIRNALDDAIWFNLRIYRNFYGLVHCVPNTYPYVYGRQMIIGTLVMVVPRLLWPGKISSSGGVSLVSIIGPNLRGTGQAYPNVGEYYYALGIFGVMLCMTMYGIWSKQLKTKMMDGAKSSLDTIEYAVLLGCNLQLIIRGYFPSNFWYVVFSILPIAVARWLKRVKE